MNIFDRADIGQDEFRRQLNDVNAAQRDIMPRWREVLHRVFNNEENLTTAQKAQMLGVPGRRQFLRIGGIAIGGAAVLAACGDDDDEGSATTTSSGNGSGNDNGNGGDPNMDIVLANTAISLEVLAILAYETAAGSGLVETPAIGEAAALFKSHHEEHRDALIATVEGAGATAFTEANAVVKEAIVDPAVANASSEADIINLAFDLETAAAQTYVFAATALSTPQLRSTIMTIGGVENRHAQILAAVGGKTFEERFPNAFLPSENPLPEGAVITG